MISVVRQPRQPRQELVRVRQQQPAALHVAEAGFLHWIACEIDAARAIGDAPIALLNFLGEAFQHSTPCLNQAMIGRSSLQDN